MAPRAAAGTGIAARSLDMVAGLQPGAGIPDRRTGRAADTVGTARLDSAGMAVDTVDWAAAEAGCPSSCHQTCWGKLP